jgi:hypothetical protein
MAAGKSGKPVSGAWNYSRPYTSTALRRERYVFIYNHSLNVEHPQHVQ